MRAVRTLVKQHAYHFHDIKKAGQKPFFVNDFVVLHVKSTSYFKACASVTVHIHLRITKA